MLTFIYSFKPSKPPILKSKSSLSFLFFQKQGLSHKVFCWPSSVIPAAAGAITGLGH